MEQQFSHDTPCKFYKEYKKGEKFTCTNLIEFDSGENLGIINGVVVERIVYDSDEGHTWHWERINNSSSSDEEDRDEDNNI